MDEQTFKETIEKVKEQSPPRNFTESVDIAINLRDINLKIPSNRFQIDIILPHPVNDEVNICVFGEGAQLVEARELGVSRVIDKQELETISRDPKLGKKLAQEYDFFVASAPLMPIIGRTLGRFLGPRGKMPKPVPPTEELEPIINNFSRTVKLRLRQNPVIHSQVGTINMDIELLVDNALTILRSVEGKLEKGKYNIRSIYLKSTMGPAIKM